MRVKASQILEIMRSWVGMDRACGTHKPIIDLYNSHKPLARGYCVTMRDAYCATTVSAAFIKADAVDMIGGTECGADEFIKLFKKAGIWCEDGNVVPTPGAIIEYNWDIKAQPNDGPADHIGIVEKVSEGLLTVLEGNIGGKVGRRTLPVGWGQIRGYAFPDYLAEEETVYNVGWNLSFRESSKKMEWWYAYGSKRGDYYKNCVAQINGKIYAFDDEGWMKEGVFSAKTSPDGDIIAIL